MNLSINSEHFNDCEDNTDNGTDSNHEAIIVILYFKLKSQIQNKENVERSHDFLPKDFTSSGLVYHHCSRSKSFFHFSCFRSWPALCWPLHSFWNAIFLMVLKSYNCISLNKIFKISICEVYICVFSVAIEKCIFFFFNYFDSIVVILYYKVSSSVEGCIGI